jgi:hypothetical protein
MHGGNPWQRETFCPLFAFSDLGIAAKRKPLPGAGLRSAVESGIGKISIEKDGSMTRRSVLPTGLIVQAHVLGMFTSRTAS